MHGRDLNFDANTLHTTPTDNVHMRSIVGTPEGRIFMGGSNGSVYELQYETRQSWWSPLVRPSGPAHKLRKVDLTGNKVAVSRG